MTRLVLAMFTLGLLHQSAWAQPGAPTPTPTPTPAPQPQPVYNPGQPVQLVTPEESELLLRGEIDPGVAVAGGLIGTFVGLGVGHAVQGRYTDIGWIFTVGEVGGFTAAMVGLAQCIDIDTDCENLPPLFWGGIIALAGFRIWELVDVWVGPSQHNNRVRALRYRLGYPQPAPGWSLYMAPSKGDTGGKVMGLSLTF